MEKTQKRKRVQRKKDMKQLARIAVVVFTAGLGVYLLASSHAQSPYANGEAESGTLAGGAVTVSDSNASGGNAIKFGSAATYTVPNSIPSDCSTDVTTQLNNWIASVPNGTVASPSTLLLATNGCYQVDEAVNLNNLSNVVFNGQGASLKRLSDPLAGAGCCGNGVPHVSVAGDTNLTLQNLHIVGLNTTSDITTGYDPTHFGSGYSLATVAETGILANLDTNLTLTNVTTDATFGDGITIGGEHPADSQVNTATLTNVSVDRNGRQGITIDDASGVLLDHVSVLHSHASGIDIEPNGGDGGTLNVEIRNSYINSHFVAISGQGSDPVSGLNIHNNTIQYSLPSYPWVIDANGAAARHDWTVVNNTLSSPLDSPTMQFDNTTNVTVTGNTSPVDYNANPFVAKYPGVNLGNDAGTVTINNNIFSGASCGPSNGAYACSALVNPVYAKDAGTNITSACGNTVGDPSAPITNQLTGC